MRRQNVPHLLEAASGNSNVHVVVIDGGPMLDAASTVQLCQLVDAVVLAVHPHDSAPVLLRPDREVEDGSPVA